MIKGLVQKIWKKLEISSFFPNAEFASHIQGTCRGLKGEFSGKY
jgi:hypothetical protein